MNFKVLFTLIILGSAKFASCESNLDSLLGVWRDTTQNDSIRASAYNNYIWDGVLFVNPDSACVLVRDLMNFGKERKLLFVEALGHSLLGVAHDLKGNNIIALKHYTQGLKISEENGWKKRASAILDNMGLFFFYQGKYNKSLELFQRSFDIKEELGDKKGLAFLFNSFGMVYENLGNVERAFDYYQNALDQAQEIPDPQLIAAALNNLGNIYTEMKNYGSAIEHLQRSIKLSEQRSDSFSVCGSLANIGVIYLALEDHSEAMKYFKRSLELAKTISHARGIVSNEINLGRLYHDLKEYGNALNHCSNALILAKEMTNLGYQLDACRCLYGTYKLLGNTDSALTYHELMAAIQDSLQMNETALKLEQIEFDKQILTDSLLNEEEKLRIQLIHDKEVQRKKRDRNIAYVSGTLFLILAVGFYSRWRYVRRSKEVIEKERDRSESLLLNILPEAVADELKQTGRARAQKFEEVTVIFTDFKGFTSVASQMDPEQLVELINLCFARFDDLVEEFGIEKIKTIGDSYMAVSGLPVSHQDHATQAVLLALKMQEFLHQIHQLEERPTEHIIEMRVGLHSGSVVAGVVGKKKFQYDVWGDTVNTASRMESHGEVGKVNISQTTYELIKDDTAFLFEHRGKVEAKGKGEMAMYFVSLA